MMFIADPAHRNRIVEALSPFKGRHLFVNLCEHGTQGWRVS
jgi:hypothetical protein